MCLGCTEYTYDTPGKQDLEKEILWVCARIYRKNIKQPHYLQPKVESHIRAIKQTFQDIFSCRWASVTKNY